MIKDYLIILFFILTIVLSLQYYTDNYNKIILINDTFENMTGEIYRYESWEVSGFVINITDNITLLRKRCNCGNETIGCHKWWNNNPIGEMWLYAQNDSRYAPQLYSTCNHESYHVILDYPTEEEVWGTSVEHQYILNLTPNTHFPHCRWIVETRYNITFEPHYTYQG